MDYEELLKRAKSKVRAPSESERFSIPSADVSASGKLTIIKNLQEISSMLRRDQKHIAKFIFKELAIPGTIEEGKLILQRSFDKDAIDKAIRLYCNEFLYCRECGKPDTKLEKRDNITFLKCEACGAERSVKKI